MAMLTQVQCPKCLRYHFLNDTHACNVEPLKTQKRKFVRVVTRQSFHYDMEMPDGFDMFSFVVGIRSQGYLLNPMMYQPIEEIATIFVWEEGMQGVQPDNVVTFPMPPKGAA